MGKPPGDLATSTTAPAREAGRRRERVEWGLRWTADTFLHKRGEVEPRLSEEHARECLGRPELGWANTEVVSRTVVTYTTRWSAVE